MIRNKIAYLILMLVVAYNLQAQEVSVKTAKISVDFTTNTPSKIEILKPSFLTETRGFKKTKTRFIEIEGVVKDNDGVKELLINEVPVDVDESGFFISIASLKVGTNEITFSVRDAKEALTEKIFTIEREEEELTTGAGGKYYALIIANQNYDDEFINDLDNPINDAKALYDVLTERYAFEAGNIEMLEDPTNQEILNSLDLMRSRVSSKDNFLIFYAGHGYWDKESESGFWLPKNARKNRRSSWFRNSTLRDYMKEIHSNHTLLIADACFGGSIFKTRSVFGEAQGYAILNRKPSRKAMTSGTLSEVPDKSVFMKYLVKSLRDNDEKFISAAELFYDFQTAVINNNGGKNIPQFGTVQDVGDEGGDFIFIRK